MYSRPASGSIVVAAKNASRVGKALERVSACAFLRRRRPSVQHSQALHGEPIKLWRARLVL
jgi:hypothetical protein